MKTHTFSTADQSRGIVSLVVGTLAFTLLLIALLSG